MRIAELTIAAEALGKAPAESAVPALLALLKHASPLVREGAVYGLACHLGVEGVREELAWTAGFDPSPGVRESAREAIEP